MTHQAVAQVLHHVNVLMKVHDQDHPLDDLQRAALVLNPAKVPVRVHVLDHPLGDLHLVTPVLKPAIVLLRVHVMDHLRDDLQHVVLVLSQVAVQVMHLDRLHRLLDHQSNVPVIGLLNAFCLVNTGLLFFMKLN